MVYLTKRQKEILDFIEMFTKRNGYAPSLEEIAEYFGLSAVSTVHEHIANLTAKGMLRKSWNRSRSLEMMVGPGEGEVILAGTVAAGVPIEALEVPESIAVPPGMMGRGETFALRVRGRSMIGDGIFDGDVIIVEKRRQVPNGSLTVAMVDGTEATVKRFYQKGGTVTLRPSNPDMEDIVLAAERVEVRGIVTGLLRQYGRNGG